MYIFLISSLAILLYLIAAYGWGRLVTNRLCPDNQPGWAFMVVTGLGIWIFIGGILNVVNFAYPLALDALLGLGGGFAIVFAYRSLSKASITSYIHGWRYCLSSAPQFREVLIARWIPVTIIIFIFIFFVSTQMPARAFNFHDDFHTYMPRLVRMLETGSLGGNPFDAIGVDSLGAQAFMQSFFFKNQSISYVNAFDLISCFVLCLLILKEIWCTQKIHWIFLFASLITFVVINPLYVNISSLYSGSLMILGIIYSSLVFSDYMRSDDNKRIFSGVLLVSLFLSSLVALKLTFVFFAASYFIAYYGFLLLSRKNKSRELLMTGLAALMSVLFLVPWILVSLPNYISAFSLSLSGDAMSTAGDRDGLFLSKLTTVFSFKGGGFYLGYSLIALLLGILGLGSLIQLFKSSDKSRFPCLLTLSAACLAVVVTFIVNVYLFDPDTAVRYTVPVLIPVAAVASMMSWITPLTPRVYSKHDFKQIISANAYSITVFLAVALISWNFSHELLGRMSRAYQLRTQLAFPINHGYIQYNEAALGKPAAEWVYTLQRKIEAGSTIFAMISVPFHLDYARNPIFFYSESGILNPWFSIPLNNNPEATRKYLIDIGIQYVMYETHGVGMKQEVEFRRYIESPYWMFRGIGERSLKLRAILHYLSDNSQLIYRDGNVVIFNIKQRN